MRRDQVALSRPIRGARLDAGSRTELTEASLDEPLDDAGSDAYRKAIAAPRYDDSASWLPAISSATTIKVAYSHQNK